MPSKPSPSSLPSRKKEKMSKAEQQRALIVKRISMLDDDDHNNSTILVPSNNLLQNTRRSPKRAKVASDDKSKENVKRPSSTQAKKEESDDESEENVKRQCGTQPKKKESVKRAKVVSDDESNEGVKTEGLNQPAKKKRTTAQKQDASYDACNHENRNGASDNSRNLKLTTAQKRDAGYDACNHENQKGAPDKSRNLKLAKRAIVVSDDESDDDGKRQCVTQPKKKERAKRAIVVSDDESEDNVKRPCVTQPKKKERTTAQKRDASDDACNLKNRKEASDNLKNLKLTTAEKRDSCYDGSNDENHKGASDNSKNLKLESKSEEKCSTSMDRARKVQENLSAAHPSFIKTMLPSHVSGGFWFNISTNFSNAYLPKENCFVSLVDETGREFKANYLAYKSGLSGGWRAFSIHHDLQTNDVLVFHLIDPTTFKVYIVREEKFDEVDGALGLLELGPCAEEMVPVYASQKVLHTEDISPTDSQSPRSTIIDTQPEELDGIRLSDADTNVKTITSFDDFNIIVDGLVIDSKFSPAYRKKYFELCRSQNSFLHDRLLKGLNCNLVIGIILETVNIADAIKVCKTSTSIEDLRVWKTTLDGFEVLGMNVSFLCDKLNLILGIADESNVSERCARERAGACKRLRALEDKITELKVVMEKIDSEIEAEMTATVQKYEAAIKEVTSTPW